MFLRDNTAGLIKGSSSGFPKGKNGLLFKTGGYGLPKLSQFDHGGFKGNWSAHRTLFGDDDDDVKSKTVDETIVDGEVVETVDEKKEDEDEGKNAYNVVGNNEVGETIQEQIEPVESIQQYASNNKFGLLDDDDSGDEDEEEEEHNEPHTNTANTENWKQTDLIARITKFNDEHGYERGDYGYINQGVTKGIDTLLKRFDDGILHHAIRTKGDLSKYSTNQINEGKEYIKHELDDGLIMILTYDFAKEQNDELGDTYKALTTLANDLEEARTGKKVTDTQSPFHIKRGGKGSDKDKINRIRKNISDYVEKERVKLNAMNADEERKKRDEAIRNEANKLKAADTKAFIESIEKRLKALDAPQKRALIA